MTEDALKESLPGDLGRIAEAAGLEAALKIARAFRGSYIYVPGLDTLIRQARDEDIRREHHEGSTSAELAAKYGLSQRGVRTILRRLSPAPVHPLARTLLMRAK
ncbi:MAG: Mor transcription activator family protein [Nitrospirota bacterium]